MDITETLAPSSDQLDAIELVSGPRTFVIESVSAGNAEQPVQVHFVGFPRVWRPSKGMRRLLAAGWGTDASKWAGRSVTLYFDPDVSFGKDRTGGTRISHMSHLPGGKRLSVPLLISRGKSAMFTVEPLKDAPAARPAAAKSPIQQVHDAIGHYEAAFNVTQAQLEAHLGQPATAWTPQHLATLRALSAELKAGTKHVDDEFPATDGALL